MRTKVGSVIATLSVTSFALFLPGSAWAQSPSCVECGEERWDIKTLSDTKAGQVNFTPTVSTVAELADSAKMPAPTHGDSRNPSESHSYKVRAKLVGYKIELDPNPPAGKKPGDHDFHIVLQDLNSPATMVVEIPDVKCSGACTSIKKAEIEKVRADFLNGVSKAPEESFFALANPVEVEVTGVAFFDFAHKQTGLAPNCIELHPVLAFTFAQKPSAVSDPSKEPKAKANSFYHCLPESRAPAPAAVGPRTGGNRKPQKAAKTGP